MRALTLWPEWAHAVAHLGKRVENRPWPIPDALLGERIAIHAGKSIGGRPGVPATVEGQRAVEDVAYCAGVYVWSCNADHPTEPAAFALDRQPWRPIITSAIVATAVLRANSNAEGRAEWPAEAPPPSAWAWGNPASPWWWHLSGVRVLEEPVACGGRLGLWRLPKDIAAAAERADWRKA